MHDMINEAWYKVMNVCQELAVFMEESHLGDLYSRLLFIVPVWEYRRFLYFVFPDLGKTEKPPRFGWYVVCWKNNCVCWLPLWKYLSRKRTQNDWGTILVHIVCWRSEDSRVIIVIICHHWLVTVIPLWIYFSDATWHLGYTLILEVYVVILTYISPAVYTNLECNCTVVLFVWNLCILVCHCIVLWNHVHFVIHHSRPFFFHSKDCLVSFGHGHICILFRNSLLGHPVPTGSPMGLSTFFFFSSAGMICAHLLWRK